MADVDVKKSSSQQQNRPENRNVPQRRQYDPFGFSLMPSDMFNMNPFSLMRRLSEEMDRTFSSGLQGRTGQGPSGAWSPAIEVSEREGNYVVCAELPGLNKDNVNVEVTDDALIIHGERKYEHDETRGGVHRTERRYGEFHRVIPLPEGIDPEQAKANFHDGVLEVSVPMPQQRSRARQIPIQSASEGQTDQQPPAKSSTAQKQQTSNVAPEKR